MNVAILADMPVNSYSGGRYHAAILAECLASANVNVFFITNAYSPFWEDFKVFDNHHKIKFIFCSHIGKIHKISLEIDYTIVVPSSKTPDIFYKECRNFCISHNTKLIILNFETPNWYNTYSKWKCNEADWDGIKKYLCDLGCLILSSAKESMKFAEKFYGTSNKHLYYDVWNPAINSIVADTINVEKKKQIITLIRLNDAHKGAKDILDVINQPMEGYNIILVTGNGEISGEYVEKLKELSKKNGFSYEILKQISDKEKFYYIKQSEILLFPSYFEGYGYPPVEAQYCNTLCLAYDLPVLREISGNGIEYCSYGNSEDMRSKLADYIHGKKVPQNMKGNIVEQGNINNRALAIAQLLDKYKDIDWKANDGKSVKARISNVLELKYCVKKYIKYIYTIIKIPIGEKRNGKK